MRLDPAGASVAARRRRRNLARGLEPLHPAHCARYAHFEMRGRLIARQPAQDHRLNHALAKIVGKTHPRRPHSRSVNDEAEINRFGNPPTNSIRSDTALIKHVETDSAQSAAERSDRDHSLGPPSAPLERGAPFVKPCPRQGATLRMQTLSVRLRSAGAGSAGKRLSLTTITPARRFLRRIGTGLFRRSFGGLEVPARSAATWIGDHAPAFPREDQSDAHVRLDS